MVDTKAYISEYITSAEIKQESSIEFIDAPQFTEGDYGKQLDAVVRFNKEKRKLTINKGNAARLAIMWGSETEDWKGKTARIRQPKTENELATGTKLVLIPVVEITTKEIKKKELLAKGVSEEHIKLMEELGDL